MIRPIFESIRGEEGIYLRSSAKQERVRQLLKSTVTSVEFELDLRREKLKIDRQ